MKNGDNFYEIVDYVQWNIAEQFLDSILKKFKRKDIQSIKAKLFVSTVKTVKSIKIDKAFLLKILLEIYKVEKKLRYDYMKCLLEARSRKLHGIVTKTYLNDFEEFRSFLNANFDNRTELELIELFNECYNVSNGQIDFDMFYIVAQDSGFLVEDLRLNYLNLKSDISETLEVSKESHDVLKKCMEQEIKLSDNIKSYADAFGVETVSFRFIKIHAVLESKEFCQQTDLSFRLEAGDEFKRAPTLPLQTEHTQVQCQQLAEDPWQDRLFTLFPETLADECGIGLSEIVPEY